MVYVYKCDNCGEKIEDELNPEELKQSDLLCSNCYCGYYQCVNQI